MGYNPATYKPISNRGVGINNPVYHISWDDVQEFITRLNQITGQSFRMPTEAEWEYAARGGIKSKGYTYSGSNNLDKVAWHWGNSGGETHPVATKEPNELDIYDMNGNVWEFCSDCYGSISVSSSTGTSSSSYHGARGGGWNVYEPNVTCRMNEISSNRGFVVGFRLALTPSK